MPVISGTRPKRGNLNVFVELREVQLGGRGASLIALSGFKLGEGVRQPRMQVGPPFEFRISTN